MTTAVASRKTRPHEEPVPADILERVVIQGDLKDLTAQERTLYYAEVCRSVGLNPLTRPFEYLELDGKIVLYATKACSEQLRRLHDISVKIVRRALEGDIYEVTAQTVMPSGRYDESTGAVALVKEDGEWKTASSGKRYFAKNGKLIPLVATDLANARMKAECVPLDSEILTRDGFRSYNQVAVGDEVLAYDCEGDRCCWTPLEAVNVFDSSPLIRLHSEKGQFSVHCTPDHSWAVRRSEGYRPDTRTDGSRGPRGPYKSRGPERTLLKSADIRNNHRIILAGPGPECESILDPVEAAILGWAVTDGTIKRVGNCVRIGICQSKERHFPRIRELVGAVAPGAKESVSPAIRRTFPSSGRIYDTLPQHWWYLNAAISRAILQKAGFKDRSDLPHIVTRLSLEAREMMLQAMMDAEGDQRGIFANTDQRILEAFQILCMLTGRAPGQQTHKDAGCYTIRMKKTRHVAGNFLRMEPVESAPVWCPTTHYGTWVMRQNGRVTITGNTKSKRRATLSICGLGVLDESEIESIPGATRVAVEPMEPEPMPALPAPATKPKKEPTGPPGDARECWDRLQAKDRAMAKAGLCEEGELLAHIQEQARKAGFPVLPSQWPPAAINLAVQEQAGFEATRRNKPHEWLRAHLEQLGEEALQHVKENADAEGWNPDWSTWALANVKTARDWVRAWVKAQQERGEEAE